MTRIKAQAKFSLCIRTDGAEDLERRKVYRILPDRAASRDGYVRVVDESGEDYLYPAEFFVPVALPPTVARDLEDAAVAQEPTDTALPRTGGPRQRPRTMRLRAARG